MHVHLVLESHGWTSHPSGPTSKHKAPSFSVFCLFHASQTFVMPVDLTCLVLFLAGNQLLTTSGNWGTFQSSPVPGHLSTEYDVYKRHHCHPWSLWGKGPSRESTSKTDVTVLGDIIHRHDSHQLDHIHMPLVRSKSQVSCLHQEEGFIHGCEQQGGGHRAVLEVCAHSPVWLRLYLCSHPRCVHVPNLPFMVSILLRPLCAAIQHLQVFLKAQQLFSCA